MNYRALTAEELYDTSKTFFASQIINDRWIHMIEQCVRANLLREAVAAVLDDYNRCSGGHVHVTESLIDALFDADALYRGKE